MKVTLVALAVTAAVVALAGSAVAITFGQLDGNRHPNVGALVFEDEDGERGILCSGTLIEPDVLLTASHCTAFLESIGVAPDDVWVTFDPTFDDASPLLPGTYHTNPDFGFSGPGGFSDPHDIAVVVLDAPAAGITPARLPTATARCARTRRRARRRSSSTDSGASPSRASTLSERRGST